MALPSAKSRWTNSPPLYAVHAGYLSSGSMDAAGRLIVALSPVDSWFNPLGILDTNTGRITRLAADSLSDRHSGVWTPDGRIPRRPGCHARRHLGVSAARQVALTS